MNLLCVIAAIVCFVVGVALLVTGDPTGKTLWGCVFVGLAFFAASFLPWPGNLVWGPRT